MGSGLFEEPPLVTREEMEKAKLPLAYRDNCAGLLIPLNRCRTETWFMPWKCQDERHGYEKCQYNDFLKRVEKLRELKAQNEGKRFN